MKKLYLLIAALLVIGMTSMMLTEKNVSQMTTLPGMGDNQPMFLKGMITIKVKKGVGEFSSQDGKISLNIPSLDARADKYEIHLLEKRFRYNPKNMKDGMPDLSRIYRIEFPEEYSVTRVAREFSKDPNIEYAEPIPFIHLLEVPNDPMYGQLHFLPQIKADSAWDIHKGENGTEEVIIGLVDSGTEWDHEDLIENIWQNIGEDIDGDGQTLEFIGGEWVFDPDDENGVDDDDNGYIDDFIGWNFYNSSNDPNPIPGTYKWTHGTLMGGYVSGSTNNGIGISSITWNLKMIPVQAGWDTFIFQAYNAVIYTAENGADIISCSWGHYGFNSLAYQEAIDYVNGLGCIIVAAAANDDVNKNYLPASSPGVISVAALNNLDEKASYSNFSPAVTISAPGGDDGSALLTTDVNNSYSAVMGTSCATPIVSGLLGLVKSYHPEWTADQVITQVLGTADPIDHLNPGYENLLGSGRINALRALTEPSVTLEQEITVDYFGCTFQDSDNNNILEAGDTASLNIILRNYNYGVGADNATFTISTEDTDITILNDTFTWDIPADNFFTLENAFEFVVSEQATTHLAEFTLITTADVEITWGDTLSFELLVAPEGILVYQGEGTGNAYSGDFINEFLVDQGLPVFYTSHFPASFEGFDAAFLSYGNFGVELRDGTAITMQMTNVMRDYLMNGGYLYVDCGTFFGSQSYHHYPDLVELMELFSVAEQEFTQTANLFNNLYGLPGSICHDLEFSFTSQNPRWFINIMTPNENGIAAFEEEGYGIVAVQGTGAYGQKTFCFSYALGKLVDGDEGTREELMTRIAVYFELIPTGENEVIAERNDINLTIYPSPFIETISISYTLPEENHTTIEIYDINGRHISTLVNGLQPEGDHAILFDGNELPSGVYLCLMQFGEEVLCKKVVKR